MNSEASEITAKWRQSLLLEFAKGPEGTTVQAVHQKAIEQGDKASEEAYYNLARRMAHRGLLVVEKKGRVSYFKASAHLEGEWLDEDQLAAIASPEYPIFALPMLAEASRQVGSLPDRVWMEIRERLKNENGRELFQLAIEEFSDDLKDQVEQYSLERGHGVSSEDLNRIRHSVGNLIELLNGLVRHGLGISMEAVYIPGTLEDALEMLQGGGPFYDRSRLKDELGRRVEAGPFLVQVEGLVKDLDMLIVGVDGSSRMGLLAQTGEAGDFTLGHAPMVSVNAAVALANRDAKIPGSQERRPAILRLPEKPEDAQRMDNRYTLMAKMFYPDLSDSEYAHSVWSAMDLLESRASLKALSRWYVPGTSAEVPPADVVLRDGTVTPNERDFSHYRAQSNYGKITRDLIETNAKLLLEAESGDRLIAGVVKNAQLRVYAPVINRFVCRLRQQNANSQIELWPFESFNLVTDMALLTKLLGSGRSLGDPWMRTCVVLRPFHATTNFSKTYSSTPGKAPADLIKEKHEEFKAGKTDALSAEHAAFWKDFQGKADPYVKMLQKAWYGGFFLAFCPRPSNGLNLPRMEFILPKAGGEAGPFPTQEVVASLKKHLTALNTIGFEVSNEHSMFKGPENLDLMPSILINAHDAVKHWAAVFLSRVQEFIGHSLSRFVQSNPGGVRLRPWKKSEIEGFMRQMQAERERKAGGDESA